MHSTTNGYLEREILEQSDLIRKFFESMKVMDCADLEGLNLGKIGHIQLLASGSSYHAALLGAIYLENKTRFSVSVTRGCEFVLGDIGPSKKTLYLLISQSGETVDILKCVELVAAEKCQMVAITNHSNSKLAKMVRNAILMHCGEEKSVAATKTFTMTCLVLYGFSLSLARNRGLLRKKEWENSLEGFNSFSDSFRSVFKLDQQIRDKSKKLAGFNSVLCLGGGRDYPIAKEMALKIREVSLLHAEAMPIGEIKHGPIAMLDEKFMAIFVVSQNKSWTQCREIVQRVLSTGAHCVLIGSFEPEMKKLDIVQVQSHSLDLDPLLINLVGQMIALRTGQILDRDLDKPRHLTKVVAI